MMALFKLGALVFVVMACVARAADSLLPDVAPENLPFMDNMDEKEVIVLKKPPPGYEPATTDAEWEPIFQANLFRDLKRYREQVHKAGGRPLSLRALTRQLEALRRVSRRWKQLVVVVVRGNKVYHHLPSQGDAEIARRARVNLETLAEGVVRLGLDLPDTMFVFNLYDEPICRAVDGCAVPVFSMHKRFNTTSDRSYDSDVLLPHLGHPYDKLLFYPWHQKDPRAMMRSTMQNTMSPTCTRMQLAKMSASPSGSKLLDVGFSTNKKKGFHMPSSYMRPYIGMTSHATYKFLLNADGHVSSSRLGYIMQSNSVILKQRSPWIEYYYRSIKPGRHVLEYSPGNLLALLRKYQDPALDGELRRLANASQHFCAKYLTTDGKVRYTVRALQEYTRLFGTALPAFVRKLKGLKNLARVHTAAAAAATATASRGGRGGGDGRGGGGERRLLSGAVGEVDFDGLMDQLREEAEIGGQAGGEEEAGRWGGGKEAEAAWGVGEGVEAEGGGEAVETKGKAAAGRKHGDSYGGGGGE